MLAPSLLGHWVTRHQNTQSVVFYQTKSTLTALVSWFLKSLVAEGVQTDRPSVEHAWKMYENKKHMQFIDETLDVNQHQEHIMQIIEIALLCTQSPASDLIGSCFDASKWVIIRTTNQTHSH